MSVHFKFRSSRNYDSVDIGGRPSISVRDLKSSIVQDKKLNLCQDFDLVFSDPISGQEYLNEDFQIPSGSSVIIKRVPAGAQFGSCKVFGTSDANKSKICHLQNAETVDFDDFGADICPVPEGNLSCNIDNRFCIGDEENHFELKSCSKQPVEDCHKFEGSDIIEAIPQGQILPGTKSKPDIELNTKLSAFPEMQSVDFPSELKCSLCDTFFKEAVLIPCCQNSFCEKCILHVLFEKLRCPKCFSTKCKAEDLLPNLSLRQATEQFLKSHIVINDPAKALERYAPDEESGIQVHAERGFNWLHAELKDGTASRVNSNHLLKDKISKLPGHKLTEGMEDFEDFQGENQPIDEEAESNVKKKRALWVNTADVEKNYVEMARQKKGDRACYMCGSPGHLRRNCPAVSSSHPMLQSGNAVFPGAMPAYVSPYWNRPYFPPIRAFANPYDPSPIMPLNSTMFPAYMPSMYGGFGGFSRMGGTAAALKNNIDHQLYPSELDGQDYVKRRRYDEAEKAYDRKFYPDRERSGSFSEDSFNKNSLMENWHSRTVDKVVYSNDERLDRSSRVAGENPKPYHHLGRSRSEVDDLPSISSRHSRERHEHGHRSSKKHDRREHCESDSSNKRRYSERKIVKHVSEKKHHIHSESSPEPDHSTNLRKTRREKHSGHKAKPAHDEMIHYRWQMASSRSDEDNQGKYRYHKRKKEY
ncbi:Detected protein of unknown function [Hibiscus syriacus]|uniref:Uncharacterized protein n=1 Tax=Hibiscus syriacus TaxID=106335 RepID=A0A6A2WT26_HIBSY|nr:E3 ubiquitin ligase PARAQUAT TOLERANCE 3-like [Hibiscus syriacus]XP_039044169.1 E3 ubiquitin ligase PARAQUAT TOLERANCE 3-like [Hibiscus syriacus]XP_039044170.1 E3 ubiquitin ligase PARAQUAT TOLERANCE 3-like [Hibiscus syriacus]KAE8664363.1 Detected protein of unknown function [Hibiscus syriacus]